MKQILKILILSGVLASFAIQANNCCGGCCNDTCGNPIFSVSKGGCCKPCCLGPCDGSPFLLPRSQGRNGVRDLVGWQQFINRYDMCSTYGDFAITLEYNRSMRPDRIAQFYFGDQLEGCNKLLIQGDAVNPRHPKAWLANYFGLPNDYSSVLQFEPRIENFMVDFHFYIGLDDFWKGTYIRVHSPLVHTKWDFNMTECIKNRGELKFSAGLMSDSIILREDLPASFMQYMLGNTTFGDMQSKMCYGKFPICPMTKTMLADVQATFGWNIFQCDDYHFGVFFDVVFPTGTRPNACYLFEPIIGNGKHWELGFGITSSYIFYRSEKCEDRYLGLWFDATFNHLLKQCQRRSFDFCCKPNSRYMLLAEFDASDGNLAGGELDIEALYQYTGNLLPAINYTTFVVDAKINLQADIVFKFGYVRDNWSIDFGYNFWARTGEKFGCPNCMPCVDEKKYVLKGNELLYGEAYEGSTSLGIAKLSSSASSATIKCKGSVYGSGENMEGPLDNSKTAKYKIDSEYEELDYIGSPGSGPLNTSIQPVLVSRADLDMSESPSAVTHKLFLNFSHAWKCRDDRWLPFLGIGGSVELDHCSDIDCTCDCASCVSGCECVTSCESCSSSACNSNNCCSSCSQHSKTKRGGISQWGVWVKGGIYFE
ncbi:hypothetical protein ACFLYU_03305 [Candidatus Dependentiae bacterium]